MQFDLTLCRPLTVGLSEHAFSSPTSNVPASQGFDWYAESRGPLDQSQLFAAPFYKRVPVLISRLFGSGGPFAVIRFVASTVVDTLQCIAIWTFTHIGCESGEVIAPSLAHGDAASSVSFVILMGRFVASRLGIRPDDVQRGHPAVSRSACVAVGNVALHGHLALKASATLASGTQEVCRRGAADLSAVTTTFPFGSFAWLVNATEHREPVKPSSCEIRERRHNEF
jgi:hypothetical protein